jgi:putative serine esterase DUF676
MKYLSRIDLFKLPMLACFTLIFLIFQSAGCSNLKKKDTELKNIAVLSPVNSDQTCKIDCSNRDAIVFIHGIYGDRATFINDDPKFDWPAQLSTAISSSDHRVDVFTLNYKTVLLTWAEGKTTFRELNVAVMQAMRPLRKRKYRSIGIIAHSLGGNVASSYIHTLKSRVGHIARSQHAFVITLATPVLGSQYADLGVKLQDALGMTDPLLISLKSRHNPFLEMLLDYRQAEWEKESCKICRPTNLHLAFEKETMGPFKIVSELEAVEPVRSIAASPVKGFLKKNHSTIAKPTGPKDLVYEWVLYLVKKEYRRLTTWKERHITFPPGHQLCEKPARECDINLY